MKHVIIGTAGHVDHGKTVLVKALTGTDTDRLAEEKRRGITIEPGFARLDWPDGTQAGIVDVPGHEKFIKNMLAGAGGIDLAMLVIAADEGVMPQTVEHLDILSLLGVQGGLVVLTKAELVDDDWLEFVRRQALELADRELASAERYYRPASPAMKKLIAMVMEAAKAGSVPVTICGLAVGNPVNTVQYLQMGLRSFSVSPQNLLHTKKAPASPAERKPQRPRSPAFWTKRS